jgi:hypothetical protein
MNRWPWRYKGDPVDREGKEQAKRQLEVAQAIAANAAQAAREHREIMRRNNLGPRIHQALGGH